MLVEIVSDAVCPWCYLGKRRLDAALAARPDLRVDLRWLPFELNPAMPETGLPRDAYLAERFGGLDVLREAEQRITGLGAAEGIRYRFELLRTSPNTRAAHALSWLAADSARQHEVQQGLFEAYFERGEDIGRLDTLVAIGERSGLDAAAVRERLESRRDWPAIEALEHEIRAAGISGVPLFVFDRRLALSGAREPAKFAEVLDRAAAGEGP